MNKHSFHPGRETEHGNILVYILIAAALLAALSYTVANSGRGNVSQLNEDKARLAATELLEYASTLTNGVSQLRLRGVEPRAMCFDSTNWPAEVDYAHDGCVDTYNRVFHPDGAGINLGELPLGVQGAKSRQPRIWNFYGGNAVMGIGSSCENANCTDLVMAARDIRPEICSQLNDLLGISAKGDPIPTNSGLDTTPFRGDFTFYEAIGNESGSQILQAKPAGCFHRVGSPTEYVFYQVILAR